MFPSSSGQGCPLRLNLLRKGESTNSSGYMWTLCTHQLPHLHQGSPPPAQTLWFEKHVNGISVWYCLTRVTGSVWWMLAAHIPDICAGQHGWCLLSTGPFCQHWEYSSFPRFHYLRWRRMRKTMSSRWRVEVRTKRSFFACHCSALKDSGLNGGC